MQVAGVDQLNVVSEVVIALFGGQSLESGGELVGRAEACDFAHEVLQ